MYVVCTLDDRSEKPACHVVPEESLPIQTESALVEAVLDHAHVEEHQVIVELLAKQPLAAHRAASASCLIRRSEWSFGTQEAQPALGGFTKLLDPAEWTTMTCTRSSTSSALRGRLARRGRSVEAGGRHQRTSRRGSLGSRLPMNAPTAARPRRTSDSPRSRLRRPGRRATAAIVRRSPKSTCRSSCRADRDAADLRSKPHSFLLAQRLPPGD